MTPLKRAHMSHSRTRRPATLETAPEGSHVAVLYQDAEEKDAAMFPYLAGALARGEGAVCVTGGDEDDVRRGVSESARHGSRRFDGMEVLAADSTYMRDGRFDAEGTAGWLADLAAASPAGTDNRRLCIAGVLDWAGALDAPGFDGLFRYESSLSVIAPDSRHTLACFYDLTTLPATEVISVFRTHPHVVVSGMMWESPFYDPSGLRPLDVVFDKTAAG